MAHPPDTQRSSIGADIWHHLISLAEEGPLQWVPAHCGQPGNDCADELAEEATECPQQDVLADISAVVKTVARKAKIDWIAS